MENSADPHRPLTPYLDAVINYVRAGTLSFHMPGHQQGKGASEQLRELMAHGLEADLTQVMGLDDMHRPLGPCGQAQQLAARAYGSAASYFLVNGSSGGIHAMLMAALRPGQRVLLPRNAHRAALGGALLSQAEVSWYAGRWDGDMGVYHPPDLSLIQQAFDRAPGPIQALYLTSPTYYGACMPGLREVVEWAHRQEMVVLVDEAWGPHLAFHPRLPQSALEAGADLVVHSTHKLLCGLSQASMLHRQGERIEVRRLENVLSLLQTTSPNCLLLASLDAARDQMEQQGRELLEATLSLADNLREQLRQMPWLWLPENEGWDPTRLVFQHRQLRGTTVERRLREEHNLQVEMSDPLNVVCLLTLGHRAEDGQRLIEALRALREVEPEARPPARPLGDFPEAVLSPRQAFDRSSESVPWQDTEGRICAETLTPYPPGVPAVYAGEVLSKGLIERLREEARVGVLLQGAEDAFLNTVRVLR